MAEVVNVFRADRQKITHEHLKVKLNMFRNYDPTFLRIEKHVLKVNINCEGCKQKVTKLLKKIEGVHSVNIDMDQQLAEVWGWVDPEILINKLLKSGKPASLCPPTSVNNNLENLNHMQFPAHDLISGPRNQVMFPPSFENQFEGIGSSENFLNPNTFNAGSGQDFATRSFYIHERNFAGEGSVTSPVDYQGNDCNTGFFGFGSHDFQGMPSYEHNHLPSMRITSSQQGYNPSSQQGYNQYNNPPTNTAHIYMQDGYTNNNSMNNDIYMLPPDLGNHAPPMYPPYLFQ